MLMIREGLGEPRAAQKMTLTYTDMHMKVTYSTKLIQMMTMTYRHLIMFHNYPHFLLGS